MKVRRITSLTAMLSFVIMIVTSIILYIIPQGRIANWANWNLAGLDKDQWGAIHINVGFLFLLTLCLHLFFNWKAITTYLKTRSRELKLFTKEFNIALALVVICTLGTYAEVPPFSTILDFSASIKNRAANTYGEPPYGHAELSSIEDFSKKMQIDADAALNRLQAAGYQVESTRQVISDIAEINHISPQQVVTRMSPEPSQSAQQSTIMPAPAAGVGRLTLAMLCEKYQLDIDQITQGLKGKQIEAEAGMKLKDIAEKHGISPHGVYEAIQAIIEPLE